MDHLPLFSLRFPLQTSVYGFRISSSSSSSSPIPRLSRLAIEISLTSFGTVLASQWFDSYSEHITSWWDKTIQLPRKGSNSNYALTDSSLSLQEALDVCLRITICVAQEPLVLLILDNRLYQVYKLEYLLRLTLGIQTLVRLHVVFVLLIITELALIDISIDNIS